MGEPEEREAGGRLYTWDEQVGGGSHGHSSQVAEAEAPVAIPYCGLVASCREGLTSLGSVGESCCLALADSFLSSEEKMAVWASRE